MEAGLLQRQVAGQIGIKVNTLAEWEKDRAEPEVRYWPRIVSFLGYDPSSGGETLADRLRRKRRELGLPRKCAAALLSIDEGTLKRYEDGHAIPGTRNRAILDRFLTRPNGATRGVISRRNRRAWQRPL